MYVLEQAGRLFQGSPRDIRLETGINQSIHSYSPSFDVSRVKLFASI